jgi:excisionase family DNA binding protein
MDASLKPQPPPLDPLLLKPGHVADLLGIGKSTVYLMLSTGELPQCRLGRRLRVPLAKLKIWVDNKSNEKAAPNAWMAEESENQGVIKHHQTCPK